MHILYACESFDHISGSPMYVYECAREMRSRGHEVTILSMHGGIMAEKAHALGINLIGWEHAMPTDVDILHLNQPTPSKAALRLFPGVPAVATLHSELEYERPYLDAAIKTYICIRPTIRGNAIRSGIAPGRTELIYNPVDTSRFRKMKKPKGKRRVLFVGTIDFLRREAIEDLISCSLTEDFDLRIVGLQRESYLKGVLPHNVTVGEPRWDIEEELALAHETAGIFLGRTTIEGWLCGKTGRIYDVDAKGAILGVTSERPTQLERFGSWTVAQRLLEIYERAITPTAS